MTTPIERIRVRCPGCGDTYATSYRASISDELDPGLAADDSYVEEMSNGTCPECGYKVVLGPLIVRGDT